MEKTIKLTMLSTKDILISVENGLTLCIKADNRVITADQLYKLLDFSRGDRYIIETINESGIDAPVLKSFSNLFSNVVNMLNQIPESDCDVYLKQ